MKWHLLTIALIVAIFGETSGYTAPQSSQPIMQPRDEISVGKVYYLGDFGDELDHVEIPSKISSANAKLGKLRLFGEVVAFSFRVRDDTNNFADGLLYERKNISKVRFFRDAKVLGIRTTGSSLEKPGPEKTVLFYCEEGFPERQIDSFFKPIQTSPK